MSHLLADEITRILAQFAGRGFDTQVVALKGPVQDGMSYSWQLVSKPYNDVYVTVQTQKPQFGKTTRGACRNPRLAAAETDTGRPGGSARLLPDR